MWEELLGGGTGEASPVGSEEARKHGSAGPAGAGQGGDWRTLRTRLIYLVLPPPMISCCLSPIGLAMVFIFVLITFTNIMLEQSLILFGLSAEIGEHKTLD